MSTDSKFMVWEPTQTVEYRLSHHQAEISRLSRLCRDYLSVCDAKDSTIYMWEQNKKITDARIAQLEGIIRKNNDLYNNLREHRDKLKAKLNKFYDQQHRVGLTLIGLDQEEDAHDSSSD